MAIKAGYTIPLKINNFNIMKNYSLLLFMCFFWVCSLSNAQERGDIKIPDILGYKTLKCDLHLHTVFSDGTVWPAERVEEAWREGLDAISITDHIESKYRIYLNGLFNIPVNKEFKVSYDVNVKPKDIPDHNVSYEAARKAALMKDIILIKGGEITRSMPPGHCNAIFLNDVNKLDTPDWKDAFTEAHKQGAFIFWNHPWGPLPEGKTLDNYDSSWLEEHEWLYKQGFMHGIEVFNVNDYSPEAHKWAIEKNLTIMANTDYHYPIERGYKTQLGELRTMTLVFAQDRSPEAIKEALIDRRTVAYCDNNLVGEKKFLEAIFLNSIVVEKVTKTHFGFQIIIHNKSDLIFNLSKAPYNDPLFEFFSPQILPAGERSTMRIYARNESSYKTFDMKFIVDNLLVAPWEGLPVTLTFIPD